MNVEAQLASNANRQYPANGGQLPILRFQRCAALVAASCAVMEADGHVHTVWSVTAAPHNQLAAQAPAPVRYAPPLFFSVVAQED
jgi:hypothetical protein